MKKIVDLKNIDMYLCNISNLEEAIFIQDVMLDTFTSQEMDFFLPIDKDTFVKILNNPETYGYIYGTFYEGKMIGWIFLSTSSWIDNLKKVAGVDDIAADIDGVIVLPEYRGNGLQKYMVSHIEEIAKSKNIKILMAEISVNNNYSLNNMIKCGFHIVNKYMKEGKYNRNVLIKNI